EETLILALLNLRITSLEFIDDNEIRNKTKDLLKNKYDQLKANPLTIPAASSTLLSNQSSLFLIFK
ncbi:520_t:CDS:1, partial [Funneliformis geosporum]